MHKKLQLPFTAILITFLTSCSTTELTKYDSQNPCFTTIEGIFKSSIPKWNGETPILVMNRVGSDPERLSGKVVEIRENGVLFDEDRRSAIHNPEPAFYAKDEIHSFVDENGKLVFGENLHYDHTVKQLKLIFNSKLKDSIDPYSFKAKQDEIFSYCITPGSYEIDKILVQRGKGYQDISKKNIGLEFTVENSKSNYLGTLYLDYQDSLISATSFNIPLKMHSRPEGTSYAVMFGLVGATTYMLSNKGIIDTLNVKILHDDNFTPHSVNEIRNSYLK